jgi:UDP-N-acetylglucosamine acyltransferase
MNTSPWSAAGRELDSLVHPTAIIDGEAKLAPDVIVGPYSIVGPGVVVGRGTVLGPHVLVERDTTLGEQCQVAKGAVIGSDPQDLKYEGEPSQLVVGDRTVVREYATLNRGTRASGRTLVGSDCLIMAYAHVAHDCEIGDHVVLSNAVNMGGHVVIEDWAMVGGLTAIHQYVRIGAHSFCGGGSRVPQDIPPYLKVAGNPVKLYGLNKVGLERRGVSEDVKSALKQAYQVLFQSKLTLTRAMGVATDEVEQIPEVRHLLTFIRSSERGVTT